MSIRSGIDDKYDINVFNSDAWKVAYEYITKAYVEDNFAGLYSSNLFRGFNYFQNGLTWQSGSLQNDGSILLVDASGNSITINKSKFDTIDASLNDLSLNKASKQDITNAINNLIDGSPDALNTLKEISSSLNNDPSFANTIINQLASKPSIDYVDEADTILQENINQAQTTLQTNINTVQTNLTNTQTNLQSQITSLNSNKAEKNYVDQADTTLQTQINTLGSSKADLTYVNQSDSTLQNNLNTVQTTLQNGINLKANSLNPVFSGTVSGVTKTMVGLSNVDNTSDANKPVSTATQSALNLKANSLNPVFSGTVSGVTKDMVGLANVDNTSDVNKPVSTAAQNALNLKANILNPAFSGTVTGTTINTGVLNVGNYINFNNGTVSNRYIYNLGGLTFSDWNDNSYAMQMYNSGTNHFIISEKNNGAFSFLGRNNVGVGTDNKFNILPNVGGGAYNLTTQSDDVLLLGSGAGADTQSLNMTVWSSTATGLRIQPTQTTMSGGANTIITDASAGIQLNGSNVSVNCNTTITGNLTMTNSDVFARSAVLSNTLFVNNVNTQDLTVNGNATISGDLSMPNSDITADDITAKSLSITGKSYMNGDVDINSNLNVFGNAEMNGSQLTVTGSINNTNCLLTRENQIYSATIYNNIGTSFNANSTTGSGTVTETVMTLTTSPFYSNTISVTVPISVNRKNNYTGYPFQIRNTYKDTITNISYVIYRNNVIWNTGNCSTSASLPRQTTVEYLTPSQSAAFSYDIFMTNATLSFLPMSSSKTIDTYRVEFTLSYNYSIVLTSLHIGVSYMYTFNTNTSVSTTNIPNIQTFGPLNDSSFVAGNYSPIKNTTEFFSGVGQLLSNDIICNSIRCKGSITGIINNGLAGYHIDGAANFLSTPIFCSMRSFGRANTDNYWYINAGFKLEIFNSNDYVNWIKTMDNTNGTTGVLYTLLDTERDRTDSFRVYFLGSEISISPLS